MNDQRPIERPPSAKPTLGQWIKRFIQIILAILILDGILFLIAGRLDWIGAWIFSILYFIFVLFFVVRTMRNDPGLMEERSRRAENVKSWDKVIMANPLYHLHRAHPRLVGGAHSRRRDRRALCHSNCVGRPDAARRAAGLSRVCAARALPAGAGDLVA